MPTIVTVGTTCGDLIFFSPDGMLLGQHSLSQGDAAPHATALAHWATSRNIEILVGLSDGSARVFSLTVDTPTPEQTAGHPDREVPLNLLSISLTQTKGLVIDPSRFRPLGPNGEDLNPEGVDAPAILDEASPVQAVAYLQPQSSKSAVSRNRVVVVYRCVPFFAGAASMRPSCLGVAHF